MSKPYFVSIGNSFYNIAVWKEVLAVDEDHVEVFYADGGSEDFYNDDDGPLADAAWAAVKRYMREERITRLGQALAERLLEKAAASLSPAEAVELLHKLGLVEEETCKRRTLAAED